MAQKPGIITTAVFAVWWAVFIVGALVLNPATMSAGQLSFVSDLITSSVPSEGGSHTIQFTTANNIPAGGKIRLLFEAGGITNLASLGVEDIDVASGSDYTIAAAPSGSTLGVVFSGSQIVITLGTGTISAGTTLTVELGTIATFGAAGNTTLLNGATTGDYIVTIRTTTAGNVTIDESGTVFVLVNPVGLSVGEPSPTPTPTPGGGGGGPPTPSPLIMSIQLWPAEFATLTPQEFAETTYADMAALAGMTQDEWWAVLSAGYNPQIASADGADLAAAMGVSASALYADLLSDYPQLSSYSVAQFSNLSLSQLAAVLGVDDSDLFAILGLTMGEIANLFGVTTTTLYNALNIEEFRYLYTQPSPTGEITFAAFPDTPDAETAALLGLTVNELYAWLNANYAPIGDSSMTELASELGTSLSSLQNALAAEFPAAASLPGFDSMTADQVAAALGINLGELYGALGLTMEDVAAVADVSQNELYDALGLEGLTYQSEPPAVFPETEITATVTPGGGPVTLGLDGEPSLFITDTMEDVGLQQIESGDWLFTTYAQATDTGGQTSLTGQIWVLSADGEMTLLFEQLITSDLSTTLTEYIVLSPQPSFDLDPGDRLVLTYVTETTGGSGAPVDVVLTIGGTEHYSFVQSPPTELTIPPVVCFRIADFNGDCRVNITDFSILMANWGPNPRNQTTDINQDGSAGIIDLSILLYWWTG